MSASVTITSVMTSAMMRPSRSAIALYGPTLPATLIERTGTDLEHLMLWQFIGADQRTAPPVGYPTEAPGCGRVDISAVVLRGGIDALRALAART